MSILTLAIIFGLLILSSSGFFLKYVLKFETSLSNCLNPLVFTLTGIIVSTQLRSFEEAVIFLGAAVIYFASLILGSRFRQRSSFFWQTVASLAGNATWYATMGILSGSEAYWLLFVPHVFGIISGRTAGATWAQYIEQRYGLKGDATKEIRLASGQRLAFMLKEKTLWVLTASLAAYLVYSCFFFESSVLTPVLIVVGLGLLQNFSYALATRASARGNNWLIAITGLFSGLTFYLSVIYLFSLGMPLVLFIPYTLSTTLGSTIGTFFSMVIEWITKSKPDQHLEVKDVKREKTREEVRREQLPYAIILVLTSVWILFQEQLFKAFGYPISALLFPISAVTIELPRILIMLTAASVFLLDEALHTINSRAGSRSHTGYHVATCVPKGLMNFLKVSYIARNSSIPDVVPIGILAGCLGTLWGKDISQKIERWLQARMDVEPVKKPALSN